MADSRPVDLPSPFVLEHSRRLRRDGTRRLRALDVAAGRGRHALALARLGFEVFGIDSRADALAAARTLGARDGLALHLWCADLTAYPLPRLTFDLVVVTRYLQRDLCPALGAALTPGGVLVYETFTEAQRGLGRGPRSPEHLLATGELPTLFPDLEVVAYEEVLAPEALARLAAVRR
jgi:SAM-dependent methyltransferase